MALWSQKEHNNVVVVSEYTSGGEGWTCVKEKENHKKTKPRRGLHNEKLFVWTGIDLLNTEGIDIPSSDSNSSSDSDSNSSSDADTDNDENAATSEEDEGEGEDDEDVDEDLLDTSSLIDVSPSVSSSDSDGDDSDDATAALPATVVPATSSEAKNGDEMKVDGEEGGEVCFICSQPFPNTHYHTLDCGHTIHDECFEKWATINGK